MTNASFLNLITSSIVKIYNIDQEQNFHEVDWLLQGENPGRVIFYHFPQIDESAITTFLQRLKGVCYSLIVVDHDFTKFKNLTNIVVIKKHEFFKVQKIILDHFYPLEVGNKKIVGITGTNGKSTTVDLSFQIAQLLGYQACSIGTLGIKSIKGFTPTQSGLTTPPFIELRKLLFKLLHEENHDVCFMEVSSHALELQRVYQLRFDAIAWTSFGQDHLDFHKNLEEYFQIKKRLYQEHLKNDQTPFLIPHREEDLINKLSDCKIIPSTPLHKRQYFELPLFLSPLFTQNNLEVALDLNEKLWGKLPQLDLFQLLPLVGRFATYQMDEKIFIIDFAHTADALENILTAVRAIFKNRKIFLVFGCGGDRDPLKRPLMGKVAAELADFFYITSDNPRSEDPMKIALDICALFTAQQKKQFKIIIKREEAISLAVQEMFSDSVCVIAGKGHENYQIINNVKYAFSDFNELKKVASLLGKTLEEINVLS